MTIIWLLRHQHAAGRSCGHLHDKEAAAWRCRDAQDRPDDWEVVWTGLPRGAVPPQRNWVWIWLGLFVVCIAALGCLLAVGAAVYFVVRGSFLASLGCLLFAVPFGGFAYALLTVVLDDIRHPKESYGWVWGD